MRIILAPAKQLQREEILSPAGMPVLLEKTEEILQYLRSLTYEELKNLWGCNSKLAEQNYDRVRRMDLKKDLSPAILAYKGIAYQYMAPTVFDEDQFAYVQEHLRILSGFYGVLKPMDGIAPHRLEMQARAHVSGTRNLYEFWGDRLYREVIDDSRTIINLASAEYSKCIERYLGPDDRYITCVFGEEIDGRIITKGVYAKMARGEMVRFMAENRIEDPEEMRKFDYLNFRYRPELSDERNYVFIGRPEVR